MSSAIKHNFEYSIFFVIKTFLKILPREIALFMGRILGNLLFILDKKHKHIAYSNLKTAFGDHFSSQKRQQIIKKSYIHFCNVMLDFVKISRLKLKQKDNLISVEGSEILEKHLLKQRGLLIFTAHFGFWEIAAHVLSKHTELNVIARPLDNPFLEKEISKFRASIGSQVIYKKNAARHVLKALHKNKMVAVLIDQNVLREEGIFIKFFGKKASTTPSLATFFLRTKAPLIPIFCYPTPEHGYHLKIMEPPLIKLSGNFQTDVMNITQKCTQIIEQEIKKQPHLWLWFHDRWRSRPLDGSESK